MTEGAACSLSVLWGQGVASGVSCRKTLSSRTCCLRKALRAAFPPPCLPPSHRCPTWAPSHTRGTAVVTSEVQRCADPPLSLNTLPLCPPQGLCFNGSAFVLYLSAAVVDASSVSSERDSHNFNSWAASSVSSPPSPHDRPLPSPRLAWGWGR